MRVSAASVAFILGLFWPVKVHAQDCEDCETSTGKIDEFRRVVTLEGDLTDEQRARMLEIADRCPVHRTLHSEIKVRSELGA